MARSRQKKNFFSVLNLLRKSSYIKDLVKFKGEKNRKICVFFTLPDPMNRKSDNPNGTPKPPNELKVELGTE